VGSVYGARGLTIQPDGKIVAVGRERYNDGTGFVTGVVGRLNADGSPDTTFGGTGIVTVPSTTVNELHAVGLQPDGKVVVAGDVYGTTHQIEVGRFNTDGSIDPTFGTGGLVNTLIGSSTTAVGVALQADGKIVVAGTSPWNSSGEKFVLVRYLASAPVIGSFTATPNPVTSGSSVTLTASNLTDANPGATINQVTYYYFDGSGNKVTLGTATQTSPGMWALTVTISLPPGTYTLYAQAQDSYGVFGNPFALNLQVV
jgi:uncharacterized delta-60 repeat protein